MNSVVDFAMLCSPRFWTLNFSLELDLLEKHSGYPGVLKDIKRSMKILRISYFSHFVKVVLVLLINVALI